MQQPTADVVYALRDEGFDVSCGYVSYVLRERLVALPQKVGAIWLWGEADVDRLRGLLRRRGRGPAQLNCQKGVTYV